MKREEKALLALTMVLAGVFVATLAFGVAHWLNGQAWWSDGANEIQWASWPGTFGALAMLAWWRWTHRCGTPRCTRIGEHPVKGTRRKVCHHHHTLACHELVHDLHRVEGMLGFGESHKRKA